MPGVPDSPLTFSNHAAQRMHERGIPLDHIAAALAGTTRTQSDGNVRYYDRTTRCTLVVNPKSGQVVTLYIATHSQAKRQQSRGRK